MRILLTSFSIITTIFSCFSQSDDTCKVFSHDNHENLVQNEKKHFILSNLKPYSSIKEHQTIKLQQIEAGTEINDFAYIIIHGNENGFGYDIITQSKVIIHQPHVPGISGNKGFSTKEDAQKTAQLKI